MAGDMLHLVFSEEITFKELRITIDIYKQCVILFYIISILIVLYNIEMCYYVIGKYPICIQI